jgi:carboxymethylenebutenolidase
MITHVQPMAPVQAATRQQSPHHVAENDPEVGSDFISYVSDGAPIRGYLAWPVGGMMEENARPGVTICHENRGLLPHIQDVARRFAKAGYIALAPDLISRSGATTDELDTDADRIAAIGALDRAQTGRDFLAAIDYVKKHAVVDPDKLAATGYCYGGGVVWQAATMSPDLRAAAPFYGSAPPLDQVPNIRAAVLGVYGELDERINASIPDLREALMAAGVTYEIKIYPRANHSFHNDTGDRYEPEAAQQAWRDTISWFAQHLGLADHDM